MNAFLTSVCRYNPPTRPPNPRNCFTKEDSSHIAYDYVSHRRTWCFCELSGFPDLCQPDKSLLLRSAAKVSFTVCLLCLISSLWWYPVKHNYSICFVDTLTRYECGKSTSWRSSVFGQGLIHWLLSTLFSITGNLHSAAS